LAKEHGISHDREVWVGSFLDDFIVYLVGTYGDLDTLFSRRKHGDSLGNCFLVALSEHLHEKTKDITPHFNECGTLLTRLRSNADKPLSRRSAMNRVNHFKQTYPVIEKDLQTLQRFFPAWLNQQIGQ